LVVLAAGVAIESFEGNTSMNWLGKVFVVVILIMSLVFMGLAMAVYATHKNWKVANENLSKELDQAKVELSRAESAHNLKVEELEREKTAALQQATKLEQERVALIDRNLQAQTELDGLRQNQREHIAAVKSTQDINQALTTDVADLRTRIRDEQQKRDRVFKTALDATEQLHQAAGEYERTKEENAQLTSQVSGMKSVMNANGINPNTPPDAVVPTVEGVVNKIERKAGAQLVEVSIGADDGLKTGNTLEVVRGSKYLGRVEIIQTSPDKSVARVNPRFQQGAIQEGDRVATRIRL
jgi:hypothetical protein